jgi:hypothetical protein
MERNDRRSRRRGIAAALLGLLALAISAAPAAAAAPVIQTLESSWSGPSDWLSDACGFPVTDEGTERIQVTLFSTDEGVDVSLHVRSRIVTTRVDTGESVVRFISRNVFHAFSGTPTFTGLASRITDPEGGLIVDAGLIRVDFATGSILFEAGPHPTFEAGGYDDCAALS